MLSRLFGIATPINSPQGAKEFKALAYECLDKHNPGTYNQALMEFGALQCTPQSPDCANCVLRDHCWAFHHQQVDVLPVKIKKITIKKRYFNYLVWLNPYGQTLLQKRKGKDIWHGLYEFPLLETHAPATTEEIASILPSATVSLYNEMPVIHKLTHQHIYTSFWIVTTTELLDNSILIADIHSYPVSALTANFITKFW